MSSFISQTQLISQFFLYSYLHNTLQSALCPFYFLLIPLFHSCYSSTFPQIITLPIDTLFVAYISGYVFIATLSAFPQIFEVFSKVFMAS